MKLKIEEIAHIFPNNTDNFQPGLAIHSVRTDSRKAILDALFIPLVGDQFDGHEFLSQAIEQGAIATLWEENKQLPNHLADDFPVFFVEDTTMALQALAKYYRETVNPIVVGITGSNGKTSTKDIVASLLKTSYRTHATSGNLNNHIGLPLTILDMKRETEILVVEMGMNDFGEIDVLSKIAQPDFAIITNIGESHIEFLGSRTGIAQAKLEILNGLKPDGILFMDGDEKLLTSAPITHQVMMCGFQQQNDFLIGDVNISDSQTEFTINQHEKYSVPLLGKHYAKNTAFAIALCKKLKVSNGKIRKGLASLKVSSMRFEWIEGINNVTLINDAFNASPTSMKASIEVVKELKNFKNKILILGDIFELGNLSIEFHQSIATVIQPPITMVLTLGEKMKYLHEQLQQEQTAVQSFHFHSPEELITFLSPLLQEETLLFFKASRGMHFEKIVEALE